MFYITTKNFFLEQCPTLNGIYVTFSRFADLFQRQPIYSISDGIKAIVVTKRSDSEWQILNSENQGVKTEFSTNDYDLLRKFQRALEELELNYSIKLSEYKQEITESVVSKPTH